jgi:hypothetical protein
VDVFGVERAEGSPDCAFGQDESEEREQVFEIAVGTVSKLVVKEPLRFVQAARIEQAVTVPPFPRMHS